jgi:iron complex transport system substrate-binding protein
MKNGFLKAGLIWLGAALLLTASCATPTTTTVTTSPPSSPVAITDQAGRTVVLDKTPQRIISLAPSNTEILFALELGERVVAVTDYCDYPPEAKTKPSIGGFSTPSIESIVALAPDLVVAASIHEDEVVPRLESQGLKVMVLAPTTIDDVLAAITLTGKICGVGDNAAKLVAGMQQRIEAVTDKTAGLPPEQRPSACYLVWHDPLMIAGTSTLQDELIEKAGGTNIAKALKAPPGYGTVSPETFLAANPAVILAGTGHGTDEDLTLQYVLTEPRLSDTDARKNNRVYGVDSDIATRPGPRIVDALEEFAHDLHPELFP